MQPANHAMEPNFLAEFLYPWNRYFTKNGGAEMFFALQPIQDLD